MKISVKAIGLVAGVAYILWQIGKYAADGIPNEQRIMEIINITQQILESIYGDYQLYQHHVIFHKE